MLQPRASIVLAAIVAAALVAPATLWASDRFRDVPADSTFHDEINALADAGVTRGCDVDRYCPAEDVTRGQMAGFLTRLGALDEGMEPVVDAATVQGLQVLADQVTVRIENAEGNDEECIPQTSSLGADIDFPAYTVTYQLFAATDAGGQIPSDVNVALRYTDEVPEPGRHLLCFRRVDGQTLPAGVYSLYRQETYDPDWEPEDQLTP